MNYDAMTDRELIHYLDLYTDDPLIRRLARMLSVGLISELEDAGMDPKTWTFDTGHSSEYPGEYIQRLHNDLQFARDELDSLEYKYNELEEESDQLRTRSIMDFIKEVKQEQSDSADLVREAMKTVKAFKDENERLKEQIDMWGRMNRV